MLKNIDDLIRLSMVVLMAIGLIAVFFNRLMVRSRNGKHVGFSIRSIQFLAASFVFPVIVILALTKDTIEPATTGTLLGTVIGYLLSGVGDSEDASSKGGNTQESNQNSAA